MKTKIIVTVLALVLLVSVGLNIVTIYNGGLQTRTDKFQKASSIVDVMTRAYCANKLTDEEIVNYTKMMPGVQDAKIETIDGKKHITYGYTNFPSQWATYSNPLTCETSVADASYDDWKTTHTILNGQYTVKVPDNFSIMSVGTDNSAVHFSVDSGDKSEFSGDITMSFDDPSQCSTDTTCYNQLNTSLSVGVDGSKRILQHFQAQVLGRTINALALINHEPETNPTEPYSHSLWYAFSIDGKGFTVKFENQTAVATDEIATYKTMMQRILSTFKKSS